MGSRSYNYTQEIADEICALIAQGLSVRTICLDDNMPSMTTFFKWVRENKEFAQQYARAKECQADALAEEILDISDDGTNDWMESHDKDGECIGWKVNGENVQRSRLRVESRKWLAGKLRPKKYGDKIDVEHGGDVTINMKKVIHSARDND